jgi:DNA-binding transcriptional MocR family regulator
MYSFVMTTSSLAYQTIAVQLQNAIRKGVWAPGEKLPSVRKLSLAHGVSPPTAERALRELEARGSAVARPRSGFYVAVDGIELPQPRRAAQTPVLVTLAAQVHDMFQLARSAQLLPLGAGTPYADWLPRVALARATAQSHRKLGNEAALYSVPPGRLDLRRQIARRTRTWNAPLNVERLIVTSGATQAIDMALRVITRPGDIVIVESPCYFGSLMLLKRHGLRIIEINSHPLMGISLDDVERVILSNKPAALLLAPTANNPLGFSMSTHDKKNLVKLLTKHRIPLIEDDLYGDLSSTRREPPCKAFDESGMVVYCSSVSKTLAPGWRLGWIEAGCFYEKLLESRVETSLAGSQVTELALADLMLQGDYDRHVRLFTQRIEQSVYAICARIRATWPIGTRLNRPTAGYLLWIELPERVNTQILQQQALKLGISICPGNMFSADGDRFRNCLRINCAMPATPLLLSRLDQLGQLVNQHIEM